MPTVAFKRMMSPSRTLAKGPPADASGLKWMAAGILPEAPLMRPSVTIATLKPLFCKTAIGGVNLCNSGMPLALGPWKRTTAMKSFSNSPRSNAANNSSWASNTIAGASMIWRSAGTAEILITLRPKLPLSKRKPPDSSNGAAAVRTMLSSGLSLGNAFQTSCSFSLEGALA